MPLDGEETFLLADAAKYFPPLKGGRPPCANSVRRWAKIGVNGVKLEVAFIGAYRYTSREAIKRFLNAINNPGKAGTGAA